MMADQAALDLAAIDRVTGAIAQVAGQVQQLQLRVERLEYGCERMYKRVGSLSRTSQLMQQWSECLTLWLQGLQSTTVVICCYSAFLPVFCFFN